MSIRVRLTVLMLVIGFIPMVVIGVVAYVTTRSTVKTTATQQLESTATRQKQKITGLLQTKEEAGQQLAKQQDILAAVENYAADPAQNTAQVTAALVGREQADSTIQEILVADKDGSIIASTKTSDVQRLWANDLDALRGGQAVISRAHDITSNKQALFVTTRLESHGSTLGFLSVGFGLDDVAAAATDYTGLGATGETIVATHDATGVESTLFAPRFKPGTTHLAPLDTLMLFNLVSDSELQTTTDYRHQQTMVVTRPILQADWVMAVKLDTSEVFQQVDRFRNSLAIFLLLVGVGIALVAWYVSRFFTQPIVQIGQAAQSIGRGNLMTRVDLNRVDELGRLAADINTMGQSLAKYVTNVEAQRNRLDVILNSTSEGIVAIDNTGVIIMANKTVATMLEVPMSRVVGNSLHDVFAWTRDGQEFELDVTLPGTKTYSDVQVESPSGLKHYLTLVVARIGEPTAGQQKNIQTIITLHDETKDRELEAMKVDFVSMAAHELRTPLAAIRGYLELMTFKIKDGEIADTTDYLRQAHKSTVELGGLINNLLDVTRIERGTLNFSWDKLDLASEVKQAVQDARFSADDKQISLSYVGAQSDCFVIADQIALHEVINNLITNAIKYTKPHGRVEVVLKAGVNNYVVSVRDTGVGIPKQAQANLFTKFYRAQSGLSSGNTGTGLGLFIAKSIIERHHGTIGFKSEEGVGSTFAFSMPKYDPARLNSLQSEINAASGGRNMQHGWVTKNTPR